MRSWRHASLGPQAGRDTLAEESRAVLVVEFENAAKLSPKNPAPQFRLFRVYTRLNQSSKAQAAKARFDTLTAQEKAELDKRQAATKHLDLKVANDAAP